MCAMVDNVSYFQVFQRATIKRRRVITTGFYMAKLDEIGYQVCLNLNRCEGVYEQCLEIVLFHAFTALFSSPYPTSFLNFLQDFEH